MADKNQIWTGLTRVFRDVFDDPGLTIVPTTTARDIDGWDSLMHIQLLVAAEAAFGVRFNTGEVAALKNVGEMIDLIARRLDGGRAI
jgi:acyl carrier protein